MFRLLRLEDRIVLDGAAMFDTLDLLEEQDLQTEAATEAYDADALEGKDGAEDGGFDVQTPLDGGALDIFEDDGGLHVLVVSSAVEDADGLAGAARDGVTVVRYDAEETDLAGLGNLIRDALGGQKADSIAIAAHNVNGAQVQLTGGDVASLDSLDGEDQQAFWQSLGDSLAEGGRIDLLACDVAGAEGGDAFLAKLEDVAGANVAASTDVTGNEAFGGDWVLETHGVDIQATYFDAEALEGFEGTLYAGQDPDPGYNDIYDRTVPSGKYTFIEVPTDTWQDPQGTSAVSLSFSGVPSWLRYNASSEGFWALKPTAGQNATVTITASDGFGNTETDDFSVTAYSNALIPPSYPAVNDVFLVSEDAANGTVAVPAAGYRIATDGDGTVVDYAIVSGNPTNGTSFGFAIGGSGDIVVNDTSLINFNDPYVVNNTHQLEVRAVDNDGIFDFSTVNIQMEQGALQFVVDLNVTRTTLEEDPTGANTAQITVSISPSPTAPVTVNLDFQGSGADPATGPGAAAGDDYDVTAQTLEFVAGQSSRVVTLTVADDGVDEPTENFTVDIDPTGLPANYSVAAGTLTEFSIIDGARPAVGIALADVTFPENGSTVVTATLTGGTFPTDVQVPLDFTGTAVRGATADPGVNDYTTPNDFITIPAGAVSGTLTLSGVVDNIDEGGSEDFAISLVDSVDNPFNIDPAAASVNGEVIDVFVELPVVRVTANRASFFEGETFQITAFLEDGDGAPFFAPAGGINVQMDYSGGTAVKSDDFLVPGVISIAEGATSNSVTVFGVLDGIPEDNETVNVAIEPSPAEYEIGTAPFDVILKDVTAPVVTLNLDGPSLITEDPVSTTIVQAVQNTAATTPTTVTLDISGDPAADRDIDYTATYLADGSQVATNADGDWTVVIPAGETVAGIRITAIKDGVFDGEINEQIVVTAISAGTSTIDPLNDSVVVEIEDADAGDIPVVNLFVDDGGIFVAEGELDEAPGAFMKGTVKLPTGEVPPVPVTAYLVPSDAAGEAIAGTDYGLFSDALGATPIAMVDVDGTMAWPVTITDGFNKANFWVGGLGDDDIFEGTENFQLSLFDVVNGTIGPDDAIIGAINDSTPAPVIALDLNPTEVNEPAGGNDTASLTIDLTAQAGTVFGTGETTVTFSQIGNAGFTAATEDVDYTLFEADGTTPLAYDTVAGEWTATVNLDGGTTATGVFVLKGLPDEEAEGTEGFELQAGIVSTVGMSTDAVTGTIIDAAAADPLNVTLDTVTTATVTEGIGSARVDVSLSRVYNADLVVTIQFGGDADENDFFLEFDDGTTATVGAALTYDFTIPDGFGTAAGFAIKAIDDGIFEPDEDLSIQVAGISAAIPPNDFTTNVETVTIVDGLPQPEVSLFWKDGAGDPTTGADLLEPSTKFLYAGIENPVNDNVVVDLTYTDLGADFGADYTGTASITILAGETEGRILISVLDDALYEPDEELFTVAIAGVTGPAANDVPDLVTGAILPSDLDGAVQVYLAWETAAGSEALFNEGAIGEDSIIIQLDRDTHESDVVVTLQFTTTTAPGDAAFGDDYDIASGVTIDGAGEVTVTIPIGQTRAVLPISAFADTVAEPDEVFSVTIDALTGGLVAGNPAEELGGAGAQELSAVILDATDAPTIGIELLTSNLVPEEGTVSDAAQIRAVITNGVTFTEDITVTLDVIDGTGPGEAELGVDFNVAPADRLLTIAAGETFSGVLNGSGLLRVVPLDDLTFEGDEDLGIRALTAESVSGATFGVNDTVQTITIVDDEEAPTVSLTPATAEILEEGTTSTTLTLALSGNSFDSVTVTVDVFGSGTLDDGAGNGDYTLTVDGVTVTSGDLDAGAFTVEFTDGIAGNVPIVVTAIDDSEIEPDEFANFQIASVDRATLGADIASEVTIIDNDLNLFVGLALSDNGGNVSPGALISENQDAFAGDIRVGTLTVNLLDDSGAPTDAPAGFPVTVTLSLGGTAAFDDGAIVDFDYEISRNSAFTDLVTMSSVGTFDVTIAQGFNNEQLFIRGVDDNIFEGTEPFDVTAVEANFAEVSAPVATLAGQAVLVTGLVTDNDDPPAVSLTALTPTSVTEGDTAEFSLTFEGRSSVETQIAIDIVSVTDGADYPDDYTFEIVDTAGATIGHTVSGTQLIFTLGADDVFGDGSLGTAFTIRALTIDDNIFENDEDIVLSLAAGTDYTIGTSDTATATILDNDDAPIVSLGAASAATINEGGAAATMAVELSTTSGAETIVTLVFEGPATPALDSTNITAPPDDYTVQVDGVSTTFTAGGPYTLDVTIPAGSISAELTLTALADGIFEGDEDFIVRIDSAVGATPTTAPDGLNETVTITDIDTPPEVILYWRSGDPGVDGAFNENGGSDRLIAQISEPVGVNATIGIALGGDANYTPGEPYPPVTAGEDVSDLDGNTTTIVIPAGQTQGFVTFYGLEDDLYEADSINGVSGEDFVASITAVTFGADITGPVGVTATATAVIIDGPEDIPQVTLDVANTSVTEGETTTITVFRDKTAPVETVVTLEFTTTMGAEWVDDGDFSVAGNDFVTSPVFTTTVTIAAGATSANVTFEANFDGVFEPDEQVVVTLVPVENSVLAATDTSETVTIIDDGIGTPVIALENQAAGGAVGDADFAEQAFFDGTNTIPNTATLTVTLDVESFDARLITLQATGAAEPGVDYIIEVDADGTGPAGGTAVFETVTVAADGTFSFTIDAGVTAAEVRFTGVQDAFYETPESVIVSIADSDGLTVTTTGADTFTYTLIDDDPAPRVDLSVTVDQIDENGGATSLFALLKDQAGNPITAQTDITVELDFGGTASIGDDYTADKLIVTIPEGANKSPGVILESIDDFVYEGNETIVVSALSANITNAEAGDNNVATVTILEDEMGPTVSLSVDQMTIPEANGEAALTLGLSFTSPVDEVVYVYFTTTDDDSVGTFPPNGLWNWGTEARYDNTYDVDAGIDPDYWPGDYIATDQSGTGNIFGVTVPAGSPLALVEGMNAFRVVIPAGAPDHTVYLHALNDNETGDFFGLADGFLYENDETFSVSIDANSFENNLTVDPAASAATVTIIDDDAALAPNVDLAWNAGGTVPGDYAESSTFGAQNGSFDVTLDAATNQFVQVVAGLEGQPEDYVVDLSSIAWSATAGTAADNGDGTITLTFQPAALAQTATVPFSIVDDNIYEIEETFNLTIDDVVFAKVGTSDLLTMTITDEDDLPSITVQVDTNMDFIPEGTSGAVTEGDALAGPQIQFIIGKGGVETPEAVLVDYVISSGTAAGEAEAGVDFSAITSGTVTLARDNDAIAIVDLQVIGDDLDEQPGEDVIITLSNARFAVSGTTLDGAISGDTATLTIIDDDYTPEPTGPFDPFMVSEGGSEAITVDNLLYTDTDTTDADLTYEIVTAPANGLLYIGTPGDVGNSTLLETGGTFDQFILGDGAIWYQHDDSETIEDSFVYTVTDGTNTSPEATFNITVDPVNDAPAVESIIFYIQENTTGEVSNLFDGTGEGIVVTDQDGDPLTATLVIGDDTVFRLDTTTNGEVRLFVDQALDYEFQNAYALLVNVSDGEFDLDTLIVVNVKDDVSEPDPFAAGTMPTPDPILSNEQWAFRIPDEVFPDGELVTYRFVETNGLNTSPWLKFASEAQTFWYNPDVNIGPTADQTYDIEVTATYWHQNQVIKGVSQATFTLEYDYIASLEISADVLEALDFLETEDGEYFPAEDGEMIEVQEIMLARAESEESGEIQADSELAEILALLEEDPAFIELDNHSRAQTA